MDTSLASPLLRRARSAARRLSALRRKPHTAPREDPIPDHGDFPAMKQFILVGGIPRHYAGRTASILTKTRLWYEKAGIETTIITMFSSAELDDLSHHFRNQGALAPGVRLVSLLDSYPHTSSDSTDASIEHPLGELGLRALREKDQPVYRFFDDRGVYRLYKRLDYGGRLIVRDFFNENRSRTRRDEFRSDGTIQRTVYWDLQSNKPRQDIFYSPSGIPVFNHWTAPRVDGQGMETQRITYFDTDGNPTRVGFNYESILHACLDNLIGDIPAAITSEARVADEVLLNYRRPHVRRVFVLHNAHISEPYDDVHRIRSSYIPVLSRPLDTDAVVFLTRTQRADAEKHFGVNPQFKVIPHSGQTPPKSPKSARRFKSVIMMARLDQQKQVDHAVEAFRRVVDAVPDATLDIYGRGQLQQGLLTQIRRLHLGDSVKLKGYTKDVHSAYRNAGLCIMTSRYEGAPLTVVESLMHGCPVVSYDLKYGPSDIITDGVNGLLVPYGSIRGMAERIIAVLKDPELHQRLIDAASLDNESFTEDAFLRRWAGLFRDLTIDDQRTIASTEVGQSIEE